MRLEPEEVDGILVAVRSFDPDAQVYLFGSRVDDRKRGGDIDLEAAARFEPLLHVWRRRLPSVIVLAIDDEDFYGCRGGDKWGGG